MCPIYRTINCLVASIAVCMASTVLADRTDIVVIPKTLPSAQILVKNLLGDMVAIPGGTYTMGPSKSAWQSANTYPAHKVQLTGFYFPKYNTSYLQYDTYTHLNKLPFVQKDELHIWDFDRTAKYPTDGMTWNQSNDFCAWLKKATGLPFSMPTEAQWEYVARDLGKKNWAFATPNGKLEVGKNYPSNKAFTDQKGNDTGDFFPLPVGSLPCTPMGICGMNGEVDQWVKDWYDPHYYAHSPLQNPQGPKTGKLKTDRSGGSGGSPIYNNNFGRYGWKPTKHKGGFRCVINSTLPLATLKKQAMQHLNASS